MPGYEFNFPVAPSDFDRLVSRYRITQTALLRHPCCMVLATRVRGWVARESDRRPQKGSTALADRVVRAAVDRGRCNKGSSMRGAVPRFFARNLQVFVPGMTRLFRKRV